MVFLSDWDEMEISNKGYIISAILFSILIIAIVLLFVFNLPAVASAVAFWGGPCLVPAFNQRFSNKYRKNYNKKVQAINARHAEERKKYNTKR